MTQLVLRQERTEVTALFSVVAAALSLLAAAYRSSGSAGWSDAGVPAAVKRFGRRPAIRGGLLAAAAIAWIPWRAAGAVTLPIPGRLSFTDLRIRDADSNDRLRIRADFSLGPGSDGIHPAAEGLSIKLSTGGGQFYPGPDVNPIAPAEFSVQGDAPRRRWSLNDAGRARTGIERLEIVEGDSVTLFDRRAELPGLDYSTVRAEIVIGDDALDGVATLMQQPSGSGSWRLS